MIERKWQTSEIRTVLHRLHTDLCELTRTWPTDSGHELRAVAMRFVEQGDRLERIAHGECLAEINLARADLGESIRRLFGAKNFGIISDDVYEIFRHRCKCCLRLLNSLENTLESKETPGRALRLKPAFAPVASVGAEWRIATAS